MEGATENPDLRETICFAINEFESIKEKLLNKNTNVFMGIGVPFGKGGIIECMSNFEPNQAVALHARLGHILIDAGLDLKLEVIGLEDTDSIPELEAIAEAVRVKIKALKQEQEK